MGGRGGQAAPQTVGEAGRSGWREASRPGSAEHLPSLPFLHHQSWEGGPARLHSPCRRWGAT